MTSRPLAVLAICAALACSHKAAPSAPPVAPANLRAASGDSFGAVLLSWDEQAAAIDGYEAQVAGAAGDWRFLPVALVAGHAQATVALDPATPELTAVKLRLRALSAGVPTDWSNEASFQLGLLPPTNLFLASDASSVSLSWQRGSASATSLRVDRQLIAFDGSAGPWSKVAGLPAAATSFTDHDVAAWTDGAQLSYRVVYEKDAAESAPVARTTARAGPAAPADLAAASAGGASMHLTWTARSRSADRQIVLRAARAQQAFEVATLAKDATSYSDTVPTAGVYVYYLIARVGSDPLHPVQAVSGPALATTGVPGGAPFTTSGPVMPPGQAIARDSAGRFALAAAYATPLTVQVPQASGWAARTLDGSFSLQGPGVLYDGRGRLHVLYGPQPAGALPGHATHDWLDGGAWQGEPVNAAVADAVVDAAGAIYAVSCPPTGDKSAVYATNASGSFSHDTITTSAAPSLCRIAIAADGSPRIVYSSLRPVPGGGISASSDLTLLSRTDTGWVEESVPIGAGGVFSFSSYLWIFAPSAARTTIVFDALVDAPVNTHLRAIDRAASGWGGPAILGTRYDDSGQESVVAALSPDGARVAVAWNGVSTMSTLNPSQLLLRDSAGAWTKATLFDTGQHLAVGFTPAGKVWLLDGLGAAIPQPNLLYEEQ